ncbi:saccharopine dehydrogenase C-terminal domain-containing protein [Thalassotalea profundi]|uniref:Saccharopine dehydrogenase n=1 Tax=Thalassotalea profundi TaxID=2036687 RepID=A0ABQ3IQY7_9GAMM|nr:saccharopine dehydrogenase C-terminal domain-containing protein [Thalassotalea profundi]GHE86919.1 hypothetical protein GCM10011501_15210 [Thalassotalea profundi]
MKTNVHWLGTGLSSIPGIKLLSQSDNCILHIWARNVDKAKSELSEEGIDVVIHHLDWQQFSSEIKAGDIVTSMLPVTEHVKVANICLETNAHFVSSSYISPEMALLNDAAKAKSLCFINEVGLDPGIDHLFAHLLVDSYRKSAEYDVDNHLYFRSYCGGVPKIPNDFKYKFSWSPLGVLKALKSPSKWIEEGRTKSANAPWESLRGIFITPANEDFEAYPNRDSLPFVEHYNFAQNWQVKEFVRGTLRLSGWSKAWQSLFDNVSALTPSDQEQQLTDISKQLEKKYAYQENEPDRVVLYVELLAKNAEAKVWHQAYFVDEAGNKQGQAMARLVSITVTMAIESIIAKELETGVHPAPSDPKLIEQWLNKLKEKGISIEHINY